MIKLTRLNGKPFVLNAELILFVESTPDTMLTLTNHERGLVKESMDEVIQRALEYSRSVRGMVS